MMNSTATANKARSSVRFANYQQLYIVERHTDIVVCQDLWYTKSEYHSMERAIEQDVLQVRAQALAGIPFNYAGDEDASASSAFKSSVCCVGIENLLTPSFILEVTAGKDRSILAVLVAQARQDASEKDIAKASIAQTKQFALRARLRGVLHKECSNTKYVA